MTHDSNDVTCEHGWLFVVHSTIPVVKPCPTHRAGSWKRWVEGRYQARFVGEELLISEAA